MSLYFDCAIESQNKNAINTQMSWHPQATCLAVASYSEEKVGLVNVYTGEGKLSDSMNIPPHSTAQVTILTWHPLKRILAVGWESGELFLWNDHENELHEIQSLHRAPIAILKFSDGGTRLVSADASGSLVGWRADNSGNLQTAFTHELKDPLAQIVFRVSTGDPMPAFDINGLARAAVNGDERALDIFSSWRPKTGHKRNGLTTNSRENLCFYLGSTTGIVYHINESGHCSEVLQAEGGIKRLLHHEGRSLLVVITEGMVLGQFSISSDGNIVEVNKIKLSGRTNDIQVTWAGLGVLAVSTGDNSVRLWNVDSGNNYVLSLQGFGFKDNEYIMCVNYCAIKGILSAGTNLGNVAMWKYEENRTILTTEDNYAYDPEKDWALQNPTVIIGAIKQLSWGSGQMLLAVNTVREVYILNEQEMVASYKDQISVVQLSPTQLSIEFFASGTRQEVRSEIQVRGVAHSTELIAIWNLKKMTVYEVMNTDVSQVKIVNSFPCETEMCVIYEGSIYSIEGEVIQVRSSQGTVKQTLTFGEGEGTPIGVNICGNFLVTSTLSGFVKIWDLSRREAKAHIQGKNFADSLKDFGEIISARCNCTGNRVSLAVALTSLVPDPKLYIWDIEGDTVTYFNFASGRSEDEEGGDMMAPPPNSADSQSSKEDTLQDRAKRETAREIGGRFVMSHMWDPEEPRLLVCEAKTLSVPRRRKDWHLGHGSQEEKPAVVLVSVFVSPEHGIVVQDSFPLTPTYSRLLGIQVPFFYLLLTHETDSGGERKYVMQKIMRDFVGLEKCDKNTKDAMLNFSFFSSIGNMDDAFKSIKAIKSETVWENMAKMCVKTRRLDVAALCLGNMGHARGARALRQAMNEPQVDARVAMLALQLGMTEEAEKMYKSCGRFDLLNRVYQDGGVWSKALDLANTTDRIHLRSTHYNYAKHLESKGDLTGAIAHYEKSDTYKFEIPRMLFDELPTLEEYITHSKDRALRRWWAQYLESTGEMEMALQYYEAAGDHLSLVRVYCYCNNLQRASDIANETGDRAACYHLARQYENTGQSKEAIHFFSRAHAYGNAMRICKENMNNEGAADQMMNLALMAGPQEQVEAARHFASLDRPQVAKAVMLYHKAGLFSKAIDLAFQSGQVNVVGQIAAELDDSADPALISRCSEYFISNGQYDSAVNLLITGHQYNQALDLCVEHNVRVTEELAERFTLPKEENARNQVLEKVAECAYAQENYKLATKKFTQAGNKVKAMKCLLKSGDTERIVYFADVCRQADIYILAANYLQSLDWRQEGGIMSNIIKFYTRAKSTSLLAAFYESCAQVEVDEYQNYEKALAALSESYKCLASANDSREQGRLATVQYKLEKVKQFLALKSMLSTDGETVMRELQQMLTDANLDIAVNRGDIYGTMAEYYAANSNFKSAMMVLQEMASQVPKANPDHFVSAEALQAISRATGVTFTFDGGRGEANGGEGEGSEEEEEVEEEEEEEGYNALHNKTMASRTSLVNGQAKFL